MQYNTISTYFTEAVAEMTVTKALFTTYTLDIPFFESEIIPLLFSKNYSFSNDQRIKEIQVREALVESDIDIDLFYDKRMLLDNTENSIRTYPIMEYGFHEVKHDNGAFHPKMIFLLGENKSKEEELYVFAGSNNVTQPGWLDNIETMNHIMLSHTHVPTELLKEQCLDALDYLKTQTPNFTDMENSAIHYIANYLTTIPTKEEDAECYFYFSHGEKNFPAFLKDSPLGDNFKTTQIISPYFPENDKSRLFETIHADECQLFLPLEKKEGAYWAECTQKYFEHIQSVGIEWSQLLPLIQEKVNPAETRTLHAKVFEFETENGESWSFIGSVNFTQKAFFDNVEGGFLFKNKTSPKLLEHLESKDIQFKQKSQLVHPGKEEESDSNVFILHLLFNWHPKEQRLKIIAPGCLHKMITLSNHNGEELMGFECKEESFIQTENLDLLRQHLEHNSYVVADDGNASQSVLVQQSHWQYKPLNYPDLTPYEIIKIYSYMNHEKRDQYIMSALIRKLIREDEDTEYTKSVEEIKLERDFFSEYAELFYAFRRLDTLIKLNKECRDYYLHAKRPDALPSLIDQVETTAIDNVLKYLILLSSQELYKRYSQENKEVEKALETIRSIFDDQDFIAWFEEEFEKSYQRVNHEE